MKGTDEPRARRESGTDEPRARRESGTAELVPWAEGLTTAVCVAAVVAVAVVVLSVGLARVHPLWAVLLNIVAVGGLSPTLWGWRERPVLRWLLLGIVIGIAGGWVAALASAAVA